MFMKNGFRAVFAATCLLLSCSICAAQAMRVGTYDSRAIAVAYVHSDFMRQEHQGPALQERLHEQGFGTASVIEFMAKIKQEIPGVAKDAGVVLIVSKWEVVYRDPAVEYVDVTIPLVKKFGSDARVMKMIEELMKHEPISSEKLADHTDQ